MWYGLSLKRLGLNHHEGTSNICVPAYNTHVVLRTRLTCNSYKRERAISVHMKLEIKSPTELGVFIQHLSGLHTTFVRPSAGMETGEVILIAASVWLEVANGMTGSQACWYVIWASHRFPQPSLPLCNLVFTYLCWMI